MDPPENQALRGALAQALRMVEAEEALTVRAAELAAAHRTGAFDAIEGFARPLVLHAVHLLLGVPEPDPRTLVPHLIQVERLMDAGLRPEVAAETAPAREHIGRLVAGWCAAPAEGSPLAFLKERCARADVPDAVFASTVRFVALSTCGSAGAALGNALLALLRREDGIAAAARSPDRAIDELLRFDGPVQAVTRTCTADLALGGRRVRRGQEVIALVASANRDAAVFDRPDELRLDRAPNPHLALGRGAHVCLGGAVTRLLLRAAFTALADARPRLALAGEPERVPVATLRSLVRLPVADAPTARSLSAPALPTSDGITDVS